MKEFCKPVVSAILQRDNHGEMEVILQTRWKPQVSPNYSGLLEIPAGAIEAFEDIYVTLRREIKEETNLDLVRIVDNYCSDVVEPRIGDKSIAFRPFICQQVLEAEGGLPWIGFVFLCEVKGEIIAQSDEAKDPHWVTVTELRKLVEQDPAKFFPLQLPVLQYYLNAAA